MLDASVRDQAFGRNPTPAGTQLRQWLRTRRGRLVVGGKLTAELKQSRDFASWLEAAASLGRIRNVGAARLEAKVTEMERHWTGRSDDQHVIALAVVSGARILYSDDEDLRADFRNRKLVPGAPGKLYPRSEGRARDDARARLLNQPDLCPPRRVRRPT